MHGLSRTIGQPIPGIDAFCAPVFDSTNNLVLGITAMGPEATFDREWDGKVARPSGPVRWRSPARWGTCRLP